MTASIEWLIGKLDGLPRWAMDLLGWLLGGLAAIGCWYGRFWGLASFAVLLGSIILISWGAQ